MLCIYNIKLNMFIFIYRAFATRPHGKTKGKVICVNRKAETQEKNEETSKTEEKGHKSEYC